MIIKRIRLKERDAIIQSLKSGVTPKVGIQYIQVGRSNEIAALLQDIDRVVEGGSAFRLIIGEYGSGKTFFLSVVRAIALERKLVTVNADLSPDRRIHASSGQARNLYSELMRNLATRNKPEGNALTSVVEKFITQSIQEADIRKVDVTTVIQDKLAKLTEMVGGYDFAKVIEAYWKGHDQGNDALKNNAIRWLRAEYNTKTEAREDLGVRAIISDSSFYDTLKLMSLFVRQAGYSGLLVNLDELVNLYKLNSSQARTANYEQILRILNDCLQGSAEY
ncbi:MAG: ATP-binding protein, partial [Enterovibrio sp.]